MHAYNPKIDKAETNGFGMLIASYLDKTASLQFSERASLKTVRLKRAIADILLQFPHLHA